MSINICKNKCCNNSKNINLINLKKQINFQKEWSNEENQVIDYKLSSDQLFFFDNWFKNYLSKNKLKIKNLKLKKEILLLNNTIFSSKEFIIINIIKYKINNNDDLILKFTYTIINKKLKNIIEKNEIMVKYEHLNGDDLISLDDKKLNNKMNKNGISIEKFILKLKNILKDRTIISNNIEIDLKILKKYIGFYLFNINDENTIKYWKNYFSKNDLQYLNHISLSKIYKLIEIFKFKKIFNSNKYDLHYMCKFLKIDYNDTETNINLKFYKVTKIKKIFLKCFKELKIGLIKWE